MSDLSFQILEFEPSDSLATWVEALVEGKISVEQHADLGRLLAADPVARKWFVDYMQLHASLTWDGLDLADNSTEVASLDRPFPGPAILDTTIHATIGNFSSGWPVAYLVATVICGVGLLIGAFVHVSTPPQVVRQSASLPSSSPFVGRITGMVDCQWVQSAESRAHSPALAPRLSALISLGDKFALSSGLMEITYDTGGKVILQGPVTYEVESPTSGFLSVGKLTARVEKRSEIRNQRSEVRNQKSPDFCPLTSDLFAIRTPTATVTDLGTEFGVEVSNEGATVSHVYQGSVRLQVTSHDGTGEGTAQVLHENESARVDNGGGNRVIVVGSSVKPVAFARRLPTSRRMPIRLFNTGVGLEIGQPDPHWQAVAISNEPSFKPCPAVVADATIGPWLANESGASQWITFPGDRWKCVDYTFRTTFDLTGLRPATAVLLGRFIADNYVRAIRINGRDVPVPSNPRTPPFDIFRRFSITSGFVEGVNTLEIVVGNNQPESPPEAFSPMGLRVELTGTAIQKTEAAQEGRPEPTAAKR
jgi:hypothetical protein